MCRSQNNLVTEHLGQLTEFIARGPKYFCVRILFYQVGGFLFPKCFFILSNACRIFEIVHDPRMPVWDTCRPCCHTGFTKAARGPFSSRSILEWKWYGVVLGSSHFFKSIFHGPDSKWDRLVHSVRINRHIARPLNHIDRHINCKRTDILWMIASWSSNTFSSPRS